MRFNDLKKVPKQPALRLLAMANLKLDEETGLPAAASVTEVLTALEEREAWSDMFKVLAASLPVREGVWWACLAAEDVLGGGEAADTPCLKAARDWVFKPNETTREAARAAAEAADPADVADLCAGAAVMHDGKLGPGDLAQHDAPPGAAQVMVLTTVVKAIAAADGETLNTTIQTLFDRAVDIARGGNGRLEGAL